MIHIFYALFMILFEDVGGKKILLFLPFFRKNHWIKNQIKKSWPNFRTSPNFIATLCTIFIYLFYFLISIYCCMLSNTKKHEGNGKSILTKIYCHFPKARIQNFFFKWGKNIWQDVSSESEWEILNFNFFWGDLRSLFCVFDGFLYNIEKFFCESFLEALWKLGGIL
jgi:hypothetical protein